MTEKTTKVCVRLERELHRKVRVRAIEDGVSLDSLAKQWFTTYGERRDAGKQKQNKAF